MLACEHLDAACLPKVCLTLVGSFLQPVQVYTLRNVCKSWWRILPVATDAYTRSLLRWSHLRVKFQVYCSAFSWIQTWKKFSDCAWNPQHPMAQQMRAGMAHLAGGGRTFVLYGDTNAMSALHFLNSIDFEETEFDDFRCDEDGMLYQLHREGLSWVVKIWMSTNLQEECIKMNIKSLPGTMNNWSISSGYLIIWGEVNPWSGHHADFVCIYKITQLRDQKIWTPLHQFETDSNLGERLGVECNGALVLSRFGHAVELQTVHGEFVKRIDKEVSQAWILDSNVLALCKNNAVDIVDQEGCFVTRFDPPGIRMCSMIYAHGRHIYYSSGMKIYTCELISS